MHELNLAKIIKINSNLGGKEPSPWNQARGSIHGSGLDFRGSNNCTSSALTYPRSNRTKIVSKNSNP